MKSKELINHLLRLDPSGETEVAVGNVDIHFLESLPAYYDGTLQVLKRDEKGKVIGAKYCRQGDKISINTMDMCDVIIHADVEEPDIDYSELTESDQKRQKEHHDQLRKWYHDLENQLEVDGFIKWVKQKAELLTVDTNGIKDIATAFAEKNISHNDPIKVELGESYHSTRLKQYEEKFEVVIQDGFLKIRRKDGL